MKKRGGLVCVCLSTKHTGYVVAAALLMTASTKRGLTDFST